MDSILKCYSQEQLCALIYNSDPCELRNNLTCITKNKKNLYHHRKFNMNRTFPGQFAHIQNRHGSRLITVTIMINNLCVK